MNGGTGGGGLTNTMLVHEWRYRVGGEML